MTVDISAALKQFVPLLENQIRQHLQNQHPKLQEALCYTTLLGGKRLRPFLIWIIGHLLNVNPQHLLRVGAAVELLHTYSLVHDDLPAMDNSSLRRGQQTCHLRFTEAQAILTGDGLLTLAFELLSTPEAHPSAEVRCQMVTALAKASGPHGMVAGQWLDMEPGFPTHLEELDVLHSLKSGALITCSCILPVIMADLSPSTQKYWRIWSEKIGLAFQIIDDILDVTGNAEILGKPTHQDKGLSKKTYVDILGVEGGRRRAEDLIRSAQTDLLNALESPHERATDKDYQFILEQVMKYILTRQL